MGWVLLLLLVAWPVSELYVTALVADQLGWGSTLVLLLALSVLGLVVLRASTRRAGRAMARLDAAGVDPLVASRSGAAAADTTVQFAAGLLLLVPGFVTGAAGLLLLIPPVRTLVVLLLGGMVSRRISRSETASTLMTRLRVWSGGDVVQGRVVKPDDKPAPDDPPPPGLPPGPSRG